MISKLKQRASGRFYCGNCMMMQPDPPKANCFFCGDWFENYENLMIQKQIEKNENEVKENESNLFRKN